MSKLPEPYVSLIYNGVDVGGEFANHILELTWTDNLHGKADEISVKLRDNEGLWRGAWRPEPGDTVKAALGYKGGARVECGEFEIDKPKAQGSRGNETFTFKAVSAAYSKGLRTQKSKDFEKKPLKAIIEETASEEGLQVFGEIEDIFFKYKRRRRETALGFIRRLGEDFGHFVTVKDKKIIFYKRETLEKAAPVQTFEIEDGTTIIDWSVEDNSHETFSKAKVQYLDPDKQELLSGDVDDENVQTGDVLKIDERVENNEQANKLAKGRLAKANEDRKTATLTVVGDPLLMAGQKFALGKTFGKYAGEFLIHTATHSLQRGVYTTKLDGKIGEGA